jgi:hypothetical protein
VHVDFADGELAHVDRDRSTRPPEWSRVERGRFHAELLYIALERGYARGWAAHKYRERFGTWPDAPPWSPPIPIAPGQATRAWVRSRMIAYAKAAQKAGAA